MTTGNNRKVPLSPHRLGAASVIRDVSPPSGKDEDPKGKGRKTLWDKASVISQVIGALAIPIAIGALFFQVWQFNSQQQLTRDQEKIAQQQALDQQRQITLDTYIDRMSDMLFPNQLAQSKRGDEVRNVARVRTLTALDDLDPHRKAILIQFLFESGLIQPPQPNDKIQNPIIDLTQADLTNADLSYANLSSADLSSANLSHANLTNANLNNADLSSANLSHANLTNANLTNTNLNHIDLSFTHLDNANLSNTVFSIEMGGSSPSDKDPTILVTDNSSTGPTDANFTHADLREANLSNASLDSAILDGANLADATGSSNKELEKEAKSLHGTILPDGSVHP